MLCENLKCVRDSTMIHPYYMQQPGVVNAAARCASVQKSHGVFSRKHMESYLQYTVRSMFAVGLASAVLLHCKGEAERKDSRDCGLITSKDSTPELSITHAVATISRSYYACRYTSNAIRYT